MIDKLNVCWQWGVLEDQPCVRTTRIIRDPSEYRHDQRPWPHVITPTRPPATTYKKQSSVRTTTVPRLCPPFVNNNTASSDTAGKHMMTYLEVSLPFWSRSLNELKQRGSNEGHKALRAFQLPAVHLNFSSASIQCRCAIPQANFP